MDGQDGQDELGIKYSCQIFFPFAPSREILFILFILSIHVQIPSLFHPVPPKRGLHH
jgi:hypothetical protein